MTLEDLSEDQREVLLRAAEGGRFNEAYHPGWQVDQGKEESVAARRDAISRIASEVLAARVDVPVERKVFFKDTEYVAYSDRFFLAIVLARNAVPELEHYA